MGRNFQRFMLLLWKNWLLQRKHPILTIIEIVIPLLLVAFFVFLRYYTRQVEHNTKTYPEFSTSVLLGRANVSVYNFIWSPCGSMALQTIMYNAIGQNRSTSTATCVKDANELEQQMLNTNKWWAGIEFDDELASNGSIGKMIQITLRYPGELRFINESSESPRVWPTYQMFPTFPSVGPRDEHDDFGPQPNYYRETFLMLQESPSTAVIHYQMEAAQLALEDRMLPTIAMQRYPYPPWFSDSLLLSLEFAFSTIFWLGYVCTFINTVRVITNEKETQLKEIMKIMGLPNWLHWTAWFLKIFIFFMISVVMIVVLLKVSWYSNTPRSGTSSVIAYTDGFILFVFLVFYILATITLCLAISVFFSKANAAAAVAGVAWFVSDFPADFSFQHYHSMSLWLKLAIMIFPNTAMTLGCRLIIMSEKSGEGIQWDTLFSTINYEDNLTLAHVIMMLIIDAIIFLIVALYVDSVFPGEYGVPQPWYYPFTYSYWCGRSRHVGIEDDARDRIEESNVYEREPENLKAGIKIKDLGKTFRNKKTAVKDLSLNIFEGQITVLLGHNGAGKTTTMSMLTGMLLPTSGTAIINGYDIRTDMNKIRESLSLCTQHNILFGDLTVREHLYFFSKLKGMTDKKEIDAQIAILVESLELVPKIDKRSKTLSGGMKRKLSVGIAFCGNSKVCIFDEPTAGMDPAARRCVWDLMQQQKKNRTILLTTHFMDEADLLGDRIAIIAGGQLQCCGTSFFLKKKFGAGYNLVLEKMPKCDVNAITNILKRHIPSVQIETDIGSELTYLLPKEQSSVFEKMLQDLETRAPAVGIANIGISLTTMEEVFMKVGVDHHTNSGIEMSEESDYARYSNTRPNANEEHLVTGFQLKMNHFIAMMMKKYLSTIRSWPLFVIQVLIPVVLMIIAFSLISSTSPTGYTLNILPLKTYFNPVTTFSTSNLSNPYYLQFRKILSNDNEEFTDWKLEDFATNLLELGRQTITEVRKRYIFGATFKEDRIVALFNNEPFHSAPLALEYTINTILQVKMKSDDYVIHFRNHPLPLTPKTKVAATVGSGGSYGLQVAMCLAVAIAFMSALYVLFYIKERVVKSKHLQLVFGVNVSIYWVTAYFWDLFTFLFASVCIIITIACFQKDGFSTGEELGRILLLLILFGFAILPMMYVLSFIFNVPSSAYVWIAIINLIFGAMTLVILQLLQIAGIASKDVLKFLQWAFLILPHYALVTGVEEMYVKHTLNQMCAEYEEKYADIDIVCKGVPSCCERDEYFLAWGNYGIGRNVMCLVITAIILTLALTLIECRVFRYMFERRIARIPPTDDGDDTDVLEEKRKVRDAQINKKDYSIVLKDVTKYYGKFLAVNQICLGIKGGECFGLLGVNGAGKTTTFMMMTGGTLISSGDAWIYGLNVKSNMKVIYKHIGYCPQFDALLDNLTGKETLIIYCLLRGISFKKRKIVADNLAREFNLYKHLDKKVGEYSGGNKRKLSAAIACIGSPPIIFFDEPTTGMDPDAKRQLWNILGRIRERGKCLVLTTHSMEECEALCTRLTIMVNGTFKCLGTIQHLKSKYPQGYILNIKVRRLGPKLVVQDNDVKRIKEFVRSNFPSAILKESHQELLTFYILDTAGLKWSKMFGLMERSMQPLNIESYSLGQPGLEEIFLYFTKFQREEVR